ncbi:MAG TPA: hypothetical protein VFM05_12445 [Candidatus Saccharimonadales bacterium]|nr:hypothetical protein [Candidatus Saccharimonadales bacterium]
MMYHDWDYCLTLSERLSVLSILLWIVIFIDLVLLGVWLWRQIRRQA